jgi:hypothetical protein
LWGCIAISLWGCGIAEESSRTTPFEVSYSYDSGWETSWSMKVDSMGDALLCESCKQSPGLASKSISLSPPQLDTLRLLCQAYTAADLSRRYLSQKVDQTSGELHVRFGTSRTMCYCYGDSCPPEFERLRSLLHRIALGPLTSRTDTLIEIPSLAGFYPNNPATQIEKKQFP